MRKMCIKWRHSHPSVGRENIGHKLQRERFRQDIRDSYQNILVWEEIASQYNGITVTGDFRSRLGKHLSGIW